jgi:hypothetical protein
MGNFDAAGFEDRTQRRGSNAFAEGGHNAACNEDVFGHGDICSGKAEL